MEETRVTTILDSPKSSTKLCSSPRMKTRSKSVDSPGFLAESSQYLSHSTSDVSSPKSSRRPLLGKKRLIMDIDVEIVGAKIRSLNIDTDSPSGVAKKIKHCADFTDPLSTPKSILRKVHAAPVTTSSKNQVHFVSPLKTPPPAPLECITAMVAQGGSRTPRSFITPRRRLNPTRSARQCLYPADTAPENIN